MNVSWLHDRGLEGSQELSVGPPGGWAVSNLDSLDREPQKSQLILGIRLPTILLPLPGAVGRAERAYEQKAGNPREGGACSCTSLPLLEGVPVNDLEAVVTLRLDESKLHPVAATIGATSSPHISGQWRVLARSS